MPAHLVYISSDAVYADEANPVNERSALAPSTLHGMMHAARELMFRGDFRRKATLAEYGFRLPSCMDNRPLRFEEWDAMRPQTTCVSATPGA